MVISLGSNIEPRRGYLARALDALERFPETHLVAASPVEETEPVGVPEEFREMKFLNQVAIFETSLDARGFSDRMHRVEDELGRVRSVRNGPRTIDIDLIDFGGIVISEPELTLPHPRLGERDYVLVPLEDLMADPVRFLTHAGIKVKEVEDRVGHVLAELGPVTWEDEQEA